MFFFCFHFQTANLFDVKVGCVFVLTFLIATRVLVSVGAEEECKVPQDCSPDMCSEYYLLIDCIDGKCACIEGKCFEQDQKERKKNINNNNNNKTMYTRIMLICAIFSTLSRHRIS